MVEGVSANPGNEFSSVLSVSSPGDRQNFARKPDQYQVPSATGFFRTIQGMEDRKQIAFCQGFARRFRIFNENHCEVQSIFGKKQVRPKRARGRKCHPFTTILQCHSKHAQIWSGRPGILDPLELGQLAPQMRQLPMSKAMTICN